MEISVNKKHQSQFSAASTSTNQNKDRTSWKLDKQKAKPQVVPQSASSFSLKPTAKLFVSRTKSEKTKENSKDLGDDAIQIITGYHPNPSLGQYVHDILIYDIPANWENITILNYLKAWERKEIERFQAIIEGPPDSLTADTLANKKHLTNFINPLHIKAFKEVKNPDDSPPKYTKVSLGSKIGSPATGSNRIPIRSPQKDSSQSSSGCKTKGKNKKNQKMKNKSTSTFLPKKLSK
ncbi:hypothetical protein RCL_jg20994.t1 [Rhizophagus clarus]|nr:hypothetical protein RCL_jg20994.t1 [Rhizophagus clarus]